MGKQAEQNVKRRKRVRRRQNGKDGEKMEENERK